MRPIVRAAIPAAVFVALVATAFTGSWFRDEFYYLACSRRLAWGYVDHPPLSVVILWLVRHTLGESLLALRVVSALASAAVVWLTGNIARRLGAGAFGEALAMTAAAVAPVMLAFGTFYSMNVFDILFWALAARVTIDVIDDPADRRWIALGVVLGLGLLNKASVLWLGAGLGAGLLLTPARRLLLTRGPWLAGAVAAIFLAPHVWWQVQHGWPTAEFIREASRGKMLTNTPLSFVSDQILNMHPLTLPVWGAGLVALLLDQRLRRWRVLGIAFLAVTVILVVNRTSRSAYLTPAYPMLLAAGGVWWESHMQRPALRVLCLVVLALGGLATLPLAVPLLPVDTYVRYSAALGMKPSTDERNELGRLPQFFADRQGWDRLVSDVARAWNQLTPEERGRAIVMTGNYGEAGAIERLGGDMVAASGHNNYWLWGPGSRSGDPMIVLTRSRENLEKEFTSVEQAGETDCGDCMPYENHLPIFICRGLKQPLTAVWPRVKHFS
jgi:hypothetical protein